MLRAEPLETSLPEADGSETPYRVRLLSALESGAALGRARRVAKAASGEALPPGDPLLDLYEKAEVLACACEKGTKGEGGAVTWARAWKDATVALNDVDVDRIAYLYQKYNELRAKSSPFVTSMSAMTFTKMLVAASVAEEGDEAPPFWKDCAPDLQWNCFRILASQLTNSLTTSSAAGTSPEPTGAPSSATA